MDKLNGYTFLGAIFVKLVFISFQNRVYSKKKEFAFFGSKVFHSSADKFAGEHGMLWQSQTWKS